MASNVRLIEFQKETPNPEDVKYQRAIKAKTSAGQIFVHKSINDLAAWTLP